jgi:hypothetical protein
MKPAVERIDHSDPVYLSIGRAVCCECGETADYCLGPFDYCGQHARDWWMTCMPKHMHIVGYTDDGFAIGSALTEHP